MSTLGAKLTVIDSGGWNYPAAVIISLFRKAPFSKEEMPLLQIAINCGECHCRVFNDLKIKMSQVTHLLLSRIQPETVSGIPSLIFHLSDRGVGDISLVGPRGLVLYHSATQNFVKRKYPAIVTHELDPETQYRSQIDVNHAAFAWAKPIAPSSGLHIKGVACFPSNCSTSQHTSKRISQASVVYTITIQGPARLEADKQKLEDCETSLLVIDCCSIETIADLRSVVYPWQKQLQYRGTRLALHLTPRDIFESVPYQLWVKELQGESILNLSTSSVQNQTDSSHLPAYINLNSRLHAAEPSLYPLHRQQLQTENSTEPFVLNLSSRTIIFPRYENASEDSAALSEKYRVLLPIIPDRNHVAVYNKIIGDNKAQIELNNKAAARALKMRMLGVGTGNDEKSVEIKKIEQAPPSFANLKIPHLFMLGTGAAAPSKLRSCSGILMQLDCEIPWLCQTLPQGTSASCTRAMSYHGPLVLLDCGEGCLGRLKNLAHLYNERTGCSDSVGGSSSTRACRFEGNLSYEGQRKTGSAQLADSLALCGCQTAAWHALLLRLAAVFISHMHADHHTGLPALLSQFAAAMSCPSCSFLFPGRPPLIVRGPAALEPLLQVYMDLMGPHHSTAQESRASSVSEGGATNSYIPSQAIEHQLTKGSTVETADKDFTATIANQCSEIKMKETPCSPDTPISLEASITSQTHENRSVKPQEREGFLSDAEPLLLSLAEDEPARRYSVARDELCGEASSYKRHRTNETKESSARLIQFERANDPVSSRIGGVAATWRTFRVDHGCDAYGVVLTIQGDHSR
jgi:ribonuclease BN (tRNA processing enzyme)